MKIFSPFKTRITSPQMLKEVSTKKIRSFLGLELRKTWSLSQDVFKQSIEHSSLGDALHINGNGLKIKFGGEGSTETKLSLINTVFKAPNAMMKKVKAFDSNVELKGTRKYLHAKNSKVKVGNVGEELDAESSKVTAGNVGGYAYAFKSNLKAGDISKHLQTSRSKVEAGNVGDYLRAYKSSGEVKIVANNIDLTDSFFVVKAVTCPVKKENSTVRALEYSKVMATD